MNREAIKRMVPNSITKPIQSLRRSPELEYWISRGFHAAASPTIYRPASRQTPPRVLGALSHWSGIETVLAALLTDFNVGRSSCLEFGVETGYSTVALSNFFGEVTGIDTFMGDKHAGFHGDMYSETDARVAPYENIPPGQERFP